MEETAMADTLKTSIQWSLTDQGMGYLERAGLAGLCLSLTAADQRRAEGDENAEQLAQVLRWEIADTSVQLEWDNGDDLSVMSRLMEWAWQIRDGVYYLPGIHRSRDTRDNWFTRVQTHEGLVGTFLQFSGRLKPKLSEYTYVPVQIDADNPMQTVSIKYRPVEAGQKIRQLGTLSNEKICPFRDEDGVIRTISLPGWACPGASKRFGDVEENWTGGADQALLLLFAPVACFYVNLPEMKSKKAGAKSKKSTRDNWAFVVPEITSLTEFEEKCLNIQSKFQRRLDDVKVSGLGDAGLRFAVLYSGTDSLRPIKAPIINLTSMVGTDYYSSSSSYRVRTRVLQLRPSREALIRYSKMMLHMNNYRAQIKSSKNANDNTTDGGVEKATHWISRSTARGRIAENLVGNDYWYNDLISPPRWQLDELEERRRRRSDGISNEHFWFMNLQRERRELMALAQEEVMWDTPGEKVILSVFNGVLHRLLDKDEQAISRGGSRSLPERWERRVEGIRRELLHAKTLILVRKFIVEFFVEAGGSKDLTNNRVAIWNLVNHPRDWKKVRDLALLALVTFTDGRLKPREGRGTNE
jgi:CRISPR-associated protein Cas8a1/Csx13